MSVNNDTTLQNVNKLNPKHQQVLRDRAIPIDFALKHGLHSIDLAAVRRTLEQHKLPCRWPHLPLHPVTGIAIPYPECLDGIPRCRVRSDVTEYVKPGPMEGSHHGEETVKVPRYICQANVGVVPYITDEVLAAAGDTTTPLYVVEAPLKALCLTAHGYPAIGLGGVIAGAHDTNVLRDLREIVAHKELRRFRWKGRTIYIVFDAGLTDDDRPGEPMVAIGAAFVAKALSDLGADVRLVRIPYYHPQQSEPEEGRFWSATDQGPDDYIARNGINAFTALVNAAVSADPAARMQKALDATAPAEKAKAAGDLLRELFFAATLHVGGDAVRAAVAAITSKTGIGKKALKEAGDAFHARIVARQKQDDPDWLAQLAVGASGQRRATRENVELCLRHDPGLAGLVAFDQFAQTVVFGKTPPWLGQYAASKSVTAGELWTDEDDIRLAGHLAANFKILDLNEKKVSAAVGVVARDQAVHPVREYLAGLKWDGNRRVGGWLTTYFGVEQSDYAGIVGQWWLISAVARVMKPGCKVDHVLIFEGEQGLNKSSGLDVLGGDWFTDADLGDLRSKEAALALQGRWILELAEGEIFSRASAKALKAFVTKRIDDVIPKFSNRQKKLPRQCVFALTTNDEADYLTDGTGNRRFWPVRCRSIDLEALRHDRDQLWAEVVTLYNAGEPWWPVTAEEKALCREEQQERRVHDPWEERVQEGVQYVEHVTIAHVIGSILGLAAEKQGRREQLRAADCLRSIGWVEGRRTGSARRWERGPDAQPIVRTGEHLRLVMDDADEDVPDLLGSV